MPKKARYELPDEDCERLTRAEMAACRNIMALASDLHFAKDDLKNRLACVPSGQARMNMLCGGIDSLFRDILGTVSDKQRNQLKNMARDLVMKAVPKLSSNGQQVMIYIDDVKELVDCARERCKLCVMDGNECRKCTLYKWLESNVPLDDYGDNLVCPYAGQHWED